MKDSMWLTTLNKVVAITAIGVIARAIAVWGFDAGLDMVMLIVFAQLGASLGIIYRHLSYR